MKEYFNQEKTNQITDQYGIACEKSDPDRSEYCALERPHPECCADRIQYILHTGVILNQLSHAEAMLIVNDLNFEQNTWFFTTPLNIGT